MNEGLGHILLAEDSLNDIELTKEALSGQNLANQIDVVRDGQEALDYLYRQGEYAERPPGDPAVILLDLKLPRIDGLEVLSKVKGDPALRHVPVVMLTSSREEKDLVESYKLGVNSYIVKPVDFEQFADTVSQVGMYWVLANQTVA